MRRFYIFQLRYNAERMCNNLNRVVRFTNWHDAIAEGYFPKLDNMVANRVWPSRPANARLSVTFKSYFDLYLIICYLLTRDLNQGVGV